MLAIKVNTGFKAIAIDNGTTSVVVTYAQAYDLAFNLLYALGKVREVKPEDEPTQFTLYPARTTQEDEDRILDPTRELVPDLETVFRRIHRHPHP